MPIIGSEGAASSKGFGQFARASAPTYIEEVFSTWLYTGNGSTQTITNGIDLAGKGGAVFAKSRTNASGFPSWFDTNRGALKRLQSSSTLQEGTVANSLTAFNSDGFSVGSVLSASSENFVGWTFRKQPKFFDVVTYTGDGASSRNIAHNLGSVPGCFIVKETNYSGTNWRVYHRSLGNTNEVYLNTTAASTATTSWASTTPTSAVFTVGVSGGAGPNDSGSNYVAYLFAHDAGGFGLTGTDNVISCGSYTGNGSSTGPVVTIGYEPQWLLVKNASDVSNWALIDNMRGWNVIDGAANVAQLLANTASAEVQSQRAKPLSTGFQINDNGSSVNTSGATYIYIAIRRGPMKVPTDATKVFSPVAYTGNDTNPRTVGTLQVTDLAINMNRLGEGDSPIWVDRLRGPELYLDSAATSAEAGGLTGWLLGQVGQTINGIRNTNPTTYIDWLFRRAPGFFDVVCYTGTGVIRTVAHNLAAVPQMIIVKSRNISGFWPVYAEPMGNQGYVLLDATDAKSLDVIWDSTSPTSQVFSLAGPAYGVNDSGGTYVAYLFASAPGVSKVGSFTGTGATQVINCGFTGGARFVLIKATSTTGNWLVWDSARGIVAGNDPYLALNSTAAEVTNTDWVDTAATGFELSNAGGNLANSSGVSYVFLAVA
jgi:hypothetical protein